MQSGCDAVFGTAYDQTEGFLAGKGAITTSIGPAKRLATAVCSISGIPGGIFSPSPSVGAGLDRDLAPSMLQMPLVVFAILGMTAP